MHKPATHSFIVRVGVWLALAFILNLICEIGHVGLYKIWREANGPRIAWPVFHCTLGDVVIAFGVFALAAIMLWRTDWPASLPWTGGAIVVIAAIVFTAWSEWYNVFRVGAWGYTASMPMIFGNWSFATFAMAYLAASDGGRLSNARAGAVRLAKAAQSDLNQRFYKGQKMKTDMEYSYRTHSNDHPRAPFTSSSAAASASSTRYTCSMHPEIVRDAPSSCPKCGMTLIPIQGNP